MSEGKSNQQPLRVLQALPALNAGGVERGTLDFARELVARGHHSLVMSSGGVLVAQLEAEGSRHITLPVARKSLLSLLQVRRVREQLRALAPDIVHVRSRLPAWLVWLAWRGLPPATRPRLVSTFHGLYSRNRYSAIMGCGERVIAISETVKHYIETSYPRVRPELIRLVHRGVDTAGFHRHAAPPPDWREQLYGRYPHLRGQRLILMPGRLSRWKGQLDFLSMLAALGRSGVPCHGLVLGGAEANKEAYARELRAAAASLGLEGKVTFLGHRGDIACFYAISHLVCSLSRKPEPFGRTVIEALACGVPVLARDSGGPAEVLRQCFSRGLARGDDPAAWAPVAAKLLAEPGQPRLDDVFTLKTQADKTLAVYRELLGE